jgi:hypothetical protein
MNSNRKSRERSDDLRHVDPYKRSTKDKQSWLRGARRQSAQMPEDVE